MAQSISASTPMNIPLAWGFPIAFFLTLAIGVLDYKSGYEYRLAMLYLAPLALATLSLGAWAGMIVAVVAVVCWLASFYQRNFYSDQVYFIWEGFELLVIFALFVHLLWRLRTALLRADERFKRVLEGLDAGIYVLLPSTGHIAYTNPQLHGMLGEAAQDQAVQRFEQRLVFPDNVSNGLRNAFLAQEVFLQEQERVYLVRSGLIPWEGGQTGRLTVVRDITEQRNAEQLQRAQQITRSSTARAAVLAEISTTLGHELNQPLMAIATYLQAASMMLAKNGHTSSEVSGALEKCQAETARAARILQGTRQFLRQRIPARNGSDIDMVIRRAVDAACGSSPQKVRAHIELDLNIAGPKVDFDEILIEQVVINLVSNAIQSVEGLGIKGGVTVRTAAQNGGICVSVADNGLGIPEANVDQIFRPFFTSKQDGLGLGLSICRSIIEAHSGRIWHEAGPQGGAVFHFILPAA